MADEPNGADQREYTRCPMMLKVEYASTEQFLSDYTENISGGGVFIATTARFEMGQVIEFSISFPGLLERGAGLAEGLPGGLDTFGGMKPMDILFWYPVLDQQLLGSMEEAVWSA